MTSPPKTLLKTGGLDLVPLAEPHAEAILEAVLASRPELLPWMPWARAPTLDGVRRSVEEDAAAWHSGTAFSFAVIDSLTRQLLGIIGLNRHDAGMEIHYWIRSDRAGEGLTTEACRALISWAEQALGVSRLTLWAGRDNGASRRVAEKLGFVHLGPLDWEPEGGLGPFPAETYELRWGSGPRSGHR